MASDAAQPAGERIPEIGIPFHVDLDTANRDRTLNAQGHMVLVVGYPNEHLFTSRKDRTVDQQRTELDGFVFSVTGLDDLPAQITDEE